jgi:hypothetical protein
VSVVPKKLKAGKHKASVVVTSQDAYNSPHHLPIIVSVKGPIIKLSKKNISFNAVEGGDNPKYKKNRIRNRGPGKLRYKITPVDSWISVNRKKGNSTGEWDKFRIKVDISGMSAGTYTGTIEVTSTDAVNSPQTISVTLNIGVAPR